MANISSLLDTIKNAIYGRDMRSALHDAIKTVNEDTETIKTKLDTKVDKVSGKSLIDGGVADNLEYDTDKEEILIKVSKPSQGLRVKSTAFSESTQITSGSITIESDASGLGNYLSLSPFGGIMINTPTTSNADIRLATSKGTHRLSRKADQTDVDKKVDKIEGKTLIDKTVADFLSDYGGALQVKCGIFADGAIESYSEIIARGDITAKDGHDVIAYVQKEAGGSVVVHKLSEKIGLGTTVIGSTDKIRLESADNVGPSGIEINPHFSNDVGEAFIKLGVSPTSPSKTIVGTGYITGSEMENSFSISGNDIICSPNSKVTHKLSEKVDKVEGKGLVSTADIRTAVQSDNLTLADEKKITLRSTESGDTGTNVINAVGMTVGYNNMKTTIGCDSARFSFTDTNENVFINPNDVTINQGGKTVHKLSSKANSSDVFLKSGDVVLADGKKVSLSSSESGNDGTLTIRPTGISLSRDTSMGTNDVAVSVYSGISVGGYGVDISINTIDGEQHKLSEKADKAEVFLPSKDIALESGKKISITNSNDTMVATLSGEELKIAEKDNDYKYARISANDVEVKTYYTDETNDPVFVTHKLSEKVNASDVLTKTNTAAFTPTGDYQPATKKYVDDAIKAAIEEYDTKAMVLLGED